MQKKRFIDLAVHGGCSKKLGANELQILLSGLTSAQSSTQKPSYSSWLDFGRFDLGEKVLVSNVDIILPMVLSASDFGEIAVAHVLSDIYTSGATPLFALNILGIHKEMNSDKSEIIEMLDSASERLRAANISLVGGHTISEQDDLYYGLAAVGIIDRDKLVTNDGAKKGDVLVLTKPLGTSVASINWKDNLEISDTFQDVLNGMKQLNEIASKEMFNYGATACTDITGFGFLGHTHNLLLASKVSATISFGNLPIYESIKPFIEKTHVTRIWRKNFDYVEKYVNLKVDFSKTSFSPLLEIILYDAQVSGGLLVCLPQSNADNYVSKLRDNGINAAIIGEITDDNPGYIDITD
jgi:selenide,water dikinase